MYRFFADAMCAARSRFVWVLVCTCLCVAGVSDESAPAMPLSARDIVSAMVANQERAVAARNAWLFHQRCRVRLIRKNGDLAREEEREYDVRPNEEGVERELTAFAGKVQIGDKIYPYADESYRTGEIDLDGEIAKSIADDIFAQKETRDGLPGGFFPLSAAMAARHEFRLKGEEHYRNRPVYRLTFRPARKSSGVVPGGWKGEVLVDRRFLQPVLVITEQARGVPFAIRTLLGSNVKQFGFKLEYAEVEDGVWFPIRYSGEFSLRVLFGYSRRIALSLENGDFQRASAASTIHFQGVAGEPKASGGSEEGDDSAISGQVPGEPLRFGAEP